jgi:membrane protease YdiL (CAAX protease family)
VRRGKAAGLSAAFFVSGFGLSYGFIGIIAVALWQGTTPGLIEAAAVQSAVMLPVFVLVTWLIGVRLARLTPAELRWRGGLPDAARGLLIGAAPAAIVMLAAVGLAGAGWGPDGGDFSQWLGGVGQLAVLFTPSALLEEIIFRGVPLVVLALAFGRAAGLVITAVLFGLLHATNPDVTPLALGNVALAGIYLGLAFYHRGGLWTATGAHLGWNLTHAALAAPVSGLPFAMPGIDFQPGQPAWLSGGAFGPEGGVLATIVLALAIVVAARNVEPKQEACA